MPSWLIDRDKNFLSPNARVVEPGSTTISSVNFPNGEYPNKSVAVACHESDAITEVFVFDTPATIEDESTEDKIGRFAAFCIKENRVALLSHQETSPVAVAPDDTALIQGLFAHHTCTMAVNTAVHLEQE